MYQQKASYKEQTTFSSTMRTLQMKTIMQRDDKQIASVKSLIWSQISSLRVSELFGFQVNRYLAIPFNWSEKY